MNEGRLDQYMEQRDPENYQMDKLQQGQEIAQAANGWKMHSGWKDVDVYSVLCLLHNSAD